MMVNYTTRPCIVCDLPSTVELDIAKLTRWEGGEHVQNVWPERSPDERELLITGTHPACWTEIFKSEGSNS